MYPEDRKYSKDHEWIKVVGKTATIGITQYAQEQLGDMVYVELPQVDDVFEKGNTFGVVESVKAVSDCYAPISFKVTEINSNLEDQPELVNAEPYEQGWMIKVELKDPSELSELLDAAAYEKFVQEEAE